MGCSNGKIPLIVGNEHGEDLRTTNLRDYLQNFRWNIHNPNSWLGSEVSLYSPSRDSHVIMSSQACFLPVPKLGGEAKFNVAIYNYKSSPQHPAVLAIVANSQGTSAQIVDGKGDKLYFNKNGKKCSFLGERLSQHRIEQGQEKNLGKPMTTEEKQQNMILVIQVPLLVKQKKYQEEKEKIVVQSCVKHKKMYRGRSNHQKADVEDAIIKIGKEEGPFREIGNCKIERDPSYPVRVTLQYYKATSNGIVDDNSISEISNQIKESRKYGVAIGSLVVGGNMGRVTEFKNPKIPLWWDEFWLMYGPVYSQYKSSQEAANHVFKNGRFSTSSLNECQAQVLDVLGNKSSTTGPSWNVL